MADNLIFALVLLAALGSGLIAGVFFAFSSFVMRALFRLAAPPGILAMQAINITVINPWFMGVFLGTAGLCLLLGLALLFWPVPGAVWLAAGSVLYLVGTVLVTIVFNVPRNNALARLDPGGAESAGLWNRYVAVWTAWNHVRCVAALLAAAAFTLALAGWPGQG